MSKPGRPPYIQIAVDRLLAAFGDGLVGVVLYGSHARGEAREDSDVDLLVIAQKLPERWLARSIYVHKPLKSIPDAPDFSAIGYTPEEFERRFPSIFLDIGLDGDVLFDRDGYAARKLERIREIIKQTGLRRERDNGDMNWVWQNMPRRRWEITWKGFRELA